MTCAALGSAFAALATKRPTPRAAAVGNPSRSAAIPSSSPPPPAQRAGASGPGRRTGDLWLLPGRTAERGDRFYTRCMVPEDLADHHQSWLACSSSSQQEPWQTASISQPSPMIPLSTFRRGCGPTAWTGAWPLIAVSAAARAARHRAAATLFRSSHGFGATTVNRHRRELFVPGRKLK
jgi:hypothetical protein